MIIPFEPQHVLKIDVRKEQVATIESMKMTHRSLVLYGKALLSEAHNGCAYTAVNDRGIVAMAGIVKLWDDTYEAWALFSEGCSREAVTLARRIKKEVDKIESGRLQAFTECDFPVAQRFLEWLGFEKEAVLRKYSPDNKDNYVYARIF
jgi:RimJ/RimL family protein N-acetyltransferase